MRGDSADRRYESTCQKVLQTARLHAHLHKVETDDVEDCALSFLARKLMQNNGTDLSANEQDEEKLKKDANSWVKRWLARRRRRRRQEPSLCGPDGCIENGPTAQVVSKEPGPEALLQIAGMMERLLRPLPELTASQQKLMVQYFLEDARIADLQEETGRSANALYVAVHTIRKRMKRLLEGDGMDTAEVAEYRNMLDRLFLSQ